MLTLRNLSKSFGGIHATRNVSLSLGQGELRCLIGPNGAGKSTLFRLIMGLTRPDSGSVTLNGNDVTSLQPFQRVRLGLSMKYQTTRIFGDLTVEQNIKIASTAGQISKELVFWSLSDLGLNNFLKAQANTLTYAQQHWLELCMVLGSKPRVILMDEPTAGMSPEETKSTAHFVRSICARDIAVMVIEHDMSFVREINSWTVVLHQGTVFCEGTLAQIEHDPEVQRIYLGEGNGGDAA